MDSSNPRQPIQYLCSADSYHITKFQSFQPPPATLFEISVSNLSSLLYDLCVSIEKNNNNNNPPTHSLFRQVLSLPETIIFEVSSHLLKSRKLHHLLLPYFLKYISNIPTTPAYLNNEKWVEAFCAHGDCTSYHSSAGLSLMINGLYLKAEMNWDSFKGLSRLSCLRSFTLDSLEGSERVIPYLPETLQVLNLSGINLANSSNSVEQITKLNNLKSLTLSSVCILDIQQKQLFRNFPQSLTYLDLSFCSFDTNNLKHLSVLPNLLTLDLEGKSLFDKDLVHLSKQKSLNVLWFNTKKLSRFPEEFIHSLPNLKVFFCFESQRSKPFSDKFQRPLLISQDSPIEVIKSAMTLEGFLTKGMYSYLVFRYFRLKEITSDPHEGFNEFWILKTLDLLRDNISIPRIVEMSLLLLWDANCAGHILQSITKNVSFGFAQNKMVGDIMIKGGGIELILDIVSIYSQPGRFNHQVIFYCMGLITVFCRDNGIVQHQLVKHGLIENVFRTFYFESEKNSYKRFVLGVFTQLSAVPITRAVMAQIGLNSHLFSLLKEEYDSFTIPLRVFLVLNNLFCEEKYVQRSSEQIWLVVNNMLKYPDCEYITIGANVLYSMLQAPNCHQEEIEWVKLVKAIIFLSYTFFIKGSNSIEVQKIDTEPFELPLKIGKSEACYFMLESLIKLFQFIKKLGITDLKSQLEDPVCIKYFEEFLEFCLVKNNPRVQNSAATLHRLVYSN